MRANVALESTDVPYARYFGVEEHHLRLRRINGSWSATMMRAVLASGDAVTLLPWDPVSETVLLVEQLRAGHIARHDPKPWSLGAIAGRCDVLEPYEDVAGREASEEAGLQIGRLERISGYYPRQGHPPNSSSHSWAKPVWDGRVASTNCLRNRRTSARSWCSDPSRCTPYSAAKSTMRRSCFCFTDSPPTEIACSIRGGSLDGVG